MIRAAVIIRKSDGNHLRIVLSELVTFPGHLPDILIPGAGLAGCSVTAHGSAVLLRELRFVCGDMPLSGDVAFTLGAGLRSTTGQELEGGRAVSYAIRANDWTPWAQGARRAGRM